LCAATAGRPRCRNRHRRLHLDLRHHRRL